MTVTSIEEEKTRSSSHTINNKRSYTRSWIIQTNDRDDGPKTVEDAWVTSTSIQAGSSYSTPNETDTSAYAKDIRVDCIDKSGNVWRLTCNYGTWDETATSPTSQSVDKNYSFQPVTVYTDKDATGGAIVNSAGDPFDDLVEKEVFRPVYRVVRNEASFDTTSAWEYTNAVNSDTFLGESADKWKVHISADELYDQSIGTYYRVTYEFVYSDNWQLEILDQGWRESDGTNKTNIEVDGAPITQPALLDGTGQVLAEGGTPNFIEYDIYPRKAFATKFSFA